MPQAVSPCCDDRRKIKFVVDTIDYNLRYKSIGVAKYVWLFFPV